MTNRNPVKCPITEAMCYNVDCKEDYCEFDRGPMPPDWPEHEGEPESDAERELRESLKE